MTDWAILRTSGRHTLPLAESLNHGGFEAWTPAVQIRKRSAKAKDRIEIPAPLLPTYVFAKAGNLGELIDLANAERKAHPDFSVFRYFDRIPLIADPDLDALRHSEARRVKRTKERREFNPGDEVCVTDGPWVGLSGIVEHPQGRYAMVLFGRMSVRVATFLLLPSNHRAAA